MTAQSYTNTSLATARRCLTEYDLGYNLRLANDDDDSEALQVGQAWHKAFDTEDPYAALEKHAPGPLWNEKLRRLYAAHTWYWKDQPIQVEETECTFRAEMNGNVYEGQNDGKIRAGDGRRGIIERKTAGDNLSAESNYWKRLRMGVQVGLYSLTCGFVPDFILYDVVRKPTINPKRIVKADSKRMGDEIVSADAAMYCGEPFTADQLWAPLEEGRESIAMYGARLTKDIGERPEYYFARRDVARTEQDYETLIQNLHAQVTLIQFAQDSNLKGASLMHRNPDACATFGQCRFFGLCSNNIRPREGDPAPDGFHVREHLHPELAESTEE